MPRAPTLLVGCWLAAALACSGGDRPAYTRVDGAAPRLVDGAGAVLVVFWASWCPPCREELPSLRALARDPPAGLSIRTFGEDDDARHVREFFQGPPPPELGYVHDGGRAAAAAFGVDALPAAFLVVDGRLVARFTGPREWDARGMRGLLTRLASEAGAAPAATSRPGVDASAGGR